MLCPNCGTKGSTEQKFCRECGMNLEPVSKALAAHRALDAADGPATQAPIDAERCAVKRMTTWLTFGIGLFLVGLLMLSASKFFVLRPSFKFLSVCVIILSTFISLLGVLSPLRAAASRQRRAPRPGALGAAKETGRLLTQGSIEPVPSVTERTTDLLGVVRKPATRVE